MGGTGDRSSTSVNIENISHEEISLGGPVVGTNNIIQASNQLLLLTDDDNDIERLVDILDDDENNNNNKDLRPILKGRPLPILPIEKGDMDRIEEEKNVKPNNPLKRKASYDDMECEKGSTPHK